MILSVSAQKGGVGKTSLAVHLAGAFSESHGRVLLVDMDPQHSLSSTFLEDVYSAERIVSDLILDPDLRASDAVLNTSYGKIDIIPSNLGLGMAEVEIQGHEGWQLLLSDKLDDLRDSYPLILIDCPPSIGAFTTLALSSSDHVLVPLECSSYAVKSTMFLLELVEKVRSGFNPGLEVLGFVISRIDARRRLEQDYRDLIREQFGDRVFDTEIKNNVKFAEAVTLKIPVVFYRPKSEPASLIRSLLDEVLSHGKKLQDKDKG